MELSLEDVNRIRSTSASIAGAVETHLVDLDTVDPRRRADFAMEVERILLNNLIDSKEKKQ